ncbi:MarR family winged helix-turn-helix transcriptional regulator [Cellulomonas citrea]|uniref:MarR family winged helix-turn-helix transcriptional regulator n=1 Tax=Cellulomonas citrea TaxID=1909423 RepID=UPI00135C2878|nr:MarR family transcriptional regulator [Cellulomonas citrea]
MSPPEGALTVSQEVALADAIARLRRAMRRAARADDPGNDLSVAQLELLSCVQENPGSRPSQVARLLHLAPNSVTTLVNGLQARGLLTRTSGGGDRRAVSLTLTEEGERAVARWRTTSTATVRRAFGELSPTSRELLGAALPALAELVEAVDARADAPSPPTAQPCTSA